MAESMSAEFLATRIPTIQEKVAELIAKAGGDRLETELVDLLVDREMEKRKPVLVQAIDHMGVLSEELKKIDKPDHKIMNSDNTVKEEGYTPKRLEEIKKTKEKIDKLTKAFEKAFSNGNLKDLNTLLQSGKQDGKDQTKSGAEDTGETT